MLLSKAIKTFRGYMRVTDKAAETIKGYTVELNLLNCYLSEKYNIPVYLDDITVQDLEDYMGYLKEKGYAPVSRSRTLYIIRAFYNYCCKKDYIQVNISNKLEAVPVPEKERIFLSEQEIIQLLSAIRVPIVKLIANTLYYTGMRISECLNLHMEDVDLDKRVITVRNTKNKKDRYIPIHKNLHPLLTDYRSNWRKGRKNPHFFTSDSVRKVSPDYVNKHLREATRSLGWSRHVTCHIIRHSFASNLVAKNVNIVNIQKLLGHTDLATTSIYTHTNIKELESAINTM